MRYFKKIKGERVYLSPINIEDAAKYTEWLNDLEITINLSMPHNTYYEYNYNLYISHFMGIVLVGWIVVQCIMMWADYCSHFAF